MPRTSPALLTWGERIADEKLTADLVDAGEYDSGEDEFTPGSDTESSYLHDAVEIARAALAETRGPAITADNQCNLCCPGCGQGDEIDIAATVWISLCPDGTNVTARRPTVLLRSCGLLPGVICLVRTISIKHIRGACGSDGTNGDLPKMLQAAGRVSDGQQPLSAQVLGDSGLDATQITEPWTGAGGRGALQVTDAIRYACARFLWLK